MRDCWKRELSQEQAERLLDNVNRGFRSEIYITLGAPLAAYPGTSQDPYLEALRMICKHRSDRSNLVQVYVYLTRYRHRDLDELAFKQLEEMFRMFRDQRMRMLLRFTYQNESFPDATYGRIRRHLEQLGAWMHAHTELLEQTLYCVQLGLVGLWGEGHSYRHYRIGHLSETIAQLAQAVSQPYSIQVRTHAIASRAPQSVQNRLGLHDDYVIDRDDNAWAYLDPTDPAFARVLEQARYTINDAEMPWGRARYFDRPDTPLTDRMDGKRILRWMCDYSLTSFSLAHNYREMPDHPASMVHWQFQYLDAAQAAECGIVPCDALVQAFGGKMSIYDWMRYHLGYLLRIEDVQVAGDVCHITIANYGMAAPWAYRNLQLVCADGSTVESKEAFCAKELTSGQRVTYSFPLQGQTPVGIRLREYADRGACACFANATQFDGKTQYFA